jgi:CheY-like chemotaxis protein
MGAVYAERAWMKGVEMSRKLFLFEWNEDAAKARAELLKIDGWEVESESQDSARGVKRVSEWAPDVVVLDLFLKASYSREAAIALQSRSVTRDIPLVFVDGSADVAEKTIARVKSGVVTSSFELASVLDKLVPQSET